MKKLIVLIFSILLVSGGSAYGQDKVVVIPMGSSSKLEKNIYGGGQVTSGGSSFDTFGNPFTVSRYGTGSYTILLAGLRPGCADPWPMIMLTCRGAGFCYSTAMSTNCVSGDTSIYVWTTNPAGTSVDMYFSHIVLLPDAPTTTASAAKAKNMYEVCEFNTATGTETCR